jgi:hypothetical protein
MSDNIEKTFEKIQEMYGKLGYFDKYAGSVIIFVIITVVLFVFVFFCIAKSNSEVILQDWPKYRCNLNIMPIAGFITKPQNKSAFEYTQENFNYCVQNILTNVTAPVVQPFAFITNVFLMITATIANALQGIRNMFHNIRTFIQTIVTRVIMRLVNVMVPMQNVIISGKNILNQIQGVATVILYSALGSFISFKSLLGAIAKFITSVLIAMAIIIAILLAIPFTAAAAGPMIAIFLLISIPTGLLLNFMSEYLGITGFRIPRIQCFDENTLMLMNDGTKKRICEIQTGDILFDDNEVTATIKVSATGSTMYYLDDVCVSDSHIVKYNDEWIPVERHPKSVICEPYTKPYLYCLNTSNKTIVINNTIFTDWDEIYGTDIEEVTTKNPYVKTERTDLIHTNLDGGFSNDTPVKLFDGTCKRIQDILIGDRLLNGEEVYGTVTINGENVNEQFQFIFDDKRVLEGGPNLIMRELDMRFYSTLNANNKVKLEKNHNKLYHLLTDKKTFSVKDIQFYDYNAIIDIFFEKNKKKYYL